MHILKCLKSAVPEVEDLFCFGPPSVFYNPQLEIIYGTLLSKKISRAPGGHKRFILTKLGVGGGGQNRSEVKMQEVAT